MKMIYFSADPSELESLSQELAKAGIVCEVCQSIAVKQSRLQLREAELWLRHDGDYHRALLLCVAQHAGLAKKAASRLSIDELLAAAAAA